MNTPMEKTRSAWIVVGDWPVFDFPDEEATATSVWNVDYAHFAIGVNFGKYGPRSVFKYNVRTDTWTAFLSELDFNSYNSDIEIDWGNLRVFALSTNMHGECVSIFHMETKSVVHRVQMDMESVQMVNVNGIMHCLGLREDCSYRMHHIWSEDKMQWQEIETNTIVNVDVILHLIHVPSKNILLMFAYRKTRNGRKTELWRYDIESKVWENMMDIPKEYHSDPFKLSVTLTTEEQFIIIKQDNKSHFQILDIRNENEYKLRDSMIEIPRNAFSGVLTRSHGTPGLKQSLTLILGWTRRLKKLEKFAGISIPMEIGRMIAEWYSIEWIHWIMSDFPKQNNSNLRNHQKIPLHCILNEDLFLFYK